MHRFCQILIISFLLYSCGKNDPHPSGLVPKETGLVGVVTPQRFVETNFGSLVAKLSEFSNGMAFPEMGVNPLAQSYFFTEGEGMLRTRLGLVASLQSKSDLEKYLVQNASRLEQGEVSTAKIGNHTWIGYTEETIFMLYSVSGENLHNEVKERIENWKKIEEENMSINHDSLFYLPHQLSIQYDAELLKKQMGIFLESQGFFFLNKMEEGTSGKILFDALEDTLHLKITSSSKESNEWFSSKRYFEKVPSLEDEQIFYAGNVRENNSIEFFQAQPWWDLYSKRYWLQSNYAKEISTQWNGQWYLSKGTQQTIEMRSATPVFDEATGEYNLEDKIENVNVPSFMLQLGVNDANEVLDEIKRKMSAIGYSEGANKIIEISAEPLLGIGNFPRLLANGLKLYGKENMIRIASGDVSDSEILTEHDFSSSSFIWKMGGQPKAFQVFASAPEINLLIGSLEDSFEALRVEAKPNSKEVQLLAKNKKNAGLVLFEMFNELRLRYWK